MRRRVDAEREHCDRLAEREDAARRELGVSLGVALLGSILASLYRRGLAALPLPDQIAEPASKSIGAALQTAQRTTDPRLAELLAATAPASFVDGYQAALLTAAALATIAALTVHRLGPRRPARPASHAPAITT